MSSGYGVAVGAKPRSAWWGEAVGVLAVDGDIASGDLIQSRAYNEVVPEEDVPGDGWAVDDYEWVPEGGA